MPRSQESPHEMQLLHVALKAVLPYIEREGLQSLYSSRRLTANTGEHFLVYAQSNCERHRERAFAAISDSFQQDKLDMPHAIGKCFGNRPDTRRGTANRVTSLYSSGDNPTNADTFSRYRFVLAMENAAEPGYVSEKLFIAFVSGAVPIYWGSEDVFDVFNPQAFIFWNESNSSSTINRLKYLESNRSAYEEMQRHPFLLNGKATVDEYFSLYKGGKLWTAIRKMILGTRTYAPQKRATGQGAVGNAQVKAARMQTPWLH